jgi:dihydrofolate reductase
MIHFIAAIDSKSGMAGEHGIPWQGKIPNEVKYFREKTEGSTILMGYGTYVEFKSPLPNRRNVVASSKTEALKPGFELTPDARQFIQSASEDVWVIGGGGLFSQTLDLADELYLTRINGDFNCSKFFPEFESKFDLRSRSEPQTENAITYYFEIWQRK